MAFVDVETAKIAYRIFGEGKIGLVIETALNSCSAEWWHIAEKLSTKTAVLVYDRAGYGTSDVSSLKRTPRNLAEELHKLLSKLDTTEKLILIGHSQGGLYVQQFARLYPERVKGLILIDPLSANDSRFKHLLTSDEYKKSGVDKLQTLKIASALTRVGLGFLFKPLLKKSPPFYYYKNFSQDASNYILSSLTKNKQYQTAIAEYTLSHVEEEIKTLKTMDGFPEVPLTLITHHSKTAVDEIMYFGQTTLEVAEKVETIWQNLMKECLAFSPKSRFIQAQKSSHYIHLTETEILESALEEFLLAGGQL